MKTQPQWKVSSDDNSPSKSSLLSTSELSFGGDPADDEAWAMRPLPCLDEFKKNFPIGREVWHDILKLRLYQERDHWFIPLRFLLFPTLKKNSLLFRLSLTVT
jgi:hypothetical protein